MVKIRKSKVYVANQAAFPRANRKAKAKHSGGSGCSCGCGKCK